MVKTKESKLATAEKRVLNAFHKQQKMKRLKMKANLMHADGYPVYKIAETLGITEGTVRHLVSVNGGY